MLRNSSPHNINQINGENPMNLKQVAEFASEVNEIALKEVKENKDKIKLEDTISEEDKKSGKYISLEKMVKTSEKLANTTIKIDKAEKDAAKPKSVGNMQNLPYEQKLDIFLGDKDFFRAVTDLSGITIAKKLIPDAINLLKNNDNSAYQNKITEIFNFENTSNKFFEKVGIIEKGKHENKNRRNEIDQAVRQKHKEKIG